MAQTQTKKANRKTTQRKAPSKVTKGTGGLRSKKKINTWFAVIIIVAVSVAGGLLVYNSSAGSRRVSPRVRGNAVSRNYNTRFRRTTVLGVSDMTRGQTGRVVSRGEFGIRPGGTRDFHTYRTQLRVANRHYLGRNKSKTCQRATYCALVFERPTGRNQQFVTQARFCGDRKDDGRGVLCTRWSIAVARYSR